jgi:hypothetical protein
MGCVRYCVELYDFYTELWSVAACLRTQARRSFIRLSLRQKPIDSVNMVTALGFDGLKP